VKVVLVGLSHHVAPVELRERVAVAPEAAAALAATLVRAGDGEAEAICLSTCNRMELYLASRDAVAAEGQAVAALAELAGMGGEELLPRLYRLHGEAAALHLFRVAAGLDSMVPGEGEILGQVKDAYEAGAPGPILDHLFRQALHAGKQVRSETAIGESPASVSSAAAALAQQVFGDLVGRRVLVIGAGKAGELAARALAARGATIASVVNRGAERAAAVAEQVGAVAVPFERIGAELESADVVVAATGAPGLVLRREQVAAAMRARKGRPLFLIDIAVPRDLDPAIHEIDGCYLYDIDDLEAVVASSLAGRRREASRAESIVAEETDRYREWKTALDVVPAIASLRARAEEIRRHELERVEGRLARLPAADRRIVESITAQIVNKLLHLPTVRMKEAAATPNGVLYADALEHLFGLNEEERPK
jgi:glutamyl-tRNA reductase